MTCRAAAVHPVGGVALLPVTTAMPIRQDSLRLSAVSVAYRLVVVQFEVWPA
jgi:hypothetical protein